MSLPLQEGSLNFLNPHEEELVISLSAEQPQE